MNDQNEIKGGNEWKLGAQDRSGSDRAVWQAGYSSVDERVEGRALTPEQRKE